MNSNLTDKLEALRLELTEADLPSVTKYSENPEAYNAQIAKLVAQLKKDKSTGVTGIRQGYKGTGSKAYKRQMWAKMPEHERGGPDIWLDKGYVRVGGIVGLPKDIPSVKQYGDESPEAVYKWIADTMQKLKTWNDAKYANSPAVKVGEGFSDKLAALRAELEEGKGYHVGTIRLRKAGKYQKTSTGWVPVNASVKSIAARAAHTSAPQDIQHAAFGNVTHSTRAFINTPGVITYMPKPSKAGRKSPETLKHASPSGGSTPSYSHVSKATHKSYALPTPSQSKAQTVQKGVMKAEAGEHTRFSATFNRLMGYSDQRVLPEAAKPKKGKVLKVLGKQSKPTPAPAFIWKKVADMSDAEVTGEAQSLAMGARMARQYGGGINSKEAMRFKQCMQRIKDEGLLGDAEHDDLLHQWHGERGY